MPGRLRAAAVMRSRDGCRAAQRGLPDRVAGITDERERRQCHMRPLPSLQSCLLLSVRRLGLFGRAIDRALDARQVDTVFVRERR